MGIVDDIASDFTDSLEDLGEDFDIELSGVAVNAEPVTWMFLEEYEVVDPYDSERVVPRPVVFLPTSDFAGLDESNTFRRLATGDLYKAFGEPESDGMGMTMLILVKA